MSVCVWTGTHCMREWEWMERHFCCDINVRWAFFLNNRQKPQDLKRRHTPCLHAKESREERMWVEGVSGSQRVTDRPKTVCCMCEETVQWLRRTVFLRNDWMNDSLSRLAKKEIISCSWRQRMSSFYPFAHTYTLSLSNSLFSSSSLPSIAFGKLGERCFEDFYWC